MWFTYEAKQRRKKKKQQSEYENKTKFFPQYNVSTDTIISGSHPDESEARLIMMENVRGAGLDIPSYENIVQTTDGKNKNFHALVKKLKL